VDSRLAAALELQLSDWRAALCAGAQRVGWKLGMGDRERIGDGPVIGHLTSESRLPPGGVYRGPGVTSDPRLPAGGVYRGAGDDLAADAEVAVLIGAGGGIAGYAAALEICDLGGDGPPEAIVAANVFHRALALSGAVERRIEGGVEATLTVNGARAGAGHSAADLADRVRAAGGLLLEMGEELRPGDWNITGSVAQVPIEPGDEVIADLGPLGRVGLFIAPR
jgi:2-keto-4-pentenoate hydratase